MIDSKQNTDKSSVKNSNYAVWQYGNLKVYLKPEVDDAFGIIAPHFMIFIRDYVRSHNYKRILNISSGAGFLGFAALESGLCEEVVFVDHRPKAIEGLEYTIEKNNLQSVTRVYNSYNFEKVPKTEQFDLVIGKFPPFCNINPLHTTGKKFHKDDRAMDENWAMHKDFYKNVSNYLEPGAMILLTEAEPYRTVVYLPKENEVPYEIREQQPIIEFKQMMMRGELEYVDARPYYTIIPGVSVWMVVSRKSPTMMQRMTFNYNYLK